MHKCQRDKHKLYRYVIFGERLPNAGGSRPLP